MQSYRYSFPDRFRSSKELFKDSQGKALHIQDQVRTNETPARTGRVISWEYDQENNPIARIEFGPDYFEVVSPEGANSLTVVS